MDAIGMAHTCGTPGGHRATHRTISPLFETGPLHWITAQSSHYAVEEGPDAMRFAIILAGLDHSRYASA